MEAKLKSLDYMSPKEYLLKNHNINILSIVSEHVMFHRLIKY